jgi:hypothetical protein
MKYLLLLIIPLFLACEEPEQVEPIKFRSFELKVKKENPESIRYVKFLVNRFTVWRNNTRDTSFFFERRSDYFKGDSAKVQILVETRNRDAEQDTVLFNGEKLPMRIEIRDRIEWYVVRKDTTLFF